MSNSARQDPNLNLLARLFGTMAEKVIERFGQEGKEVIHEAVRAFGESRGRDIAQNVKEAGKPLTVENYLKHYDMARSASYDVETKESQNHADQRFKFCPLWATWVEEGLEEYGYIYCKEIDAALAKGYNPDIKFCHYHHFSDGKPDCHMTFSLEEKEILKRGKR